MVPFGKIYSYPGNPRVLRAQAIAALNGLQLELPAFEMMVTNRSADYLAKFPLGKVPAFEGADGFCLTEGAAIATYIAGAGPKAAQLLGADLKTKAKIAEWTLFTETEIVAHSGVAQQVVLGMRPYDAAAYDFEASQFERALGKVETAVQGGKKYLVGDELTLADLEVALYIHATAAYLFDAELAAKVPATVAYVKGIVAIPEVAKFFGEFKPVEKRKRGGP